MFRGYASPPSRCGDSQRATSASRNSLADHGHSWRSKHCSEALPLSPRPPAVRSGRVFGRDTRGDNFLGDGTGGTNCESLGGYTRFAAVLANAHALLQGDGCFRPTLVGGAVGRHGIAKGAPVGGRSVPSEARRLSAERAPATSEGARWLLSTPVRSSLRA